MDGCSFRELAALHKLSVKVGLLFNGPAEDSGAVKVQLPGICNDRVLIQDLYYLRLCEEVPGNIGQKVHKTTHTLQPKDRCPKEFDR